MPPSYMARSRASSAADVQLRSPQATSVRKLHHKTSSTSSWNRDAAHNTLLILIAGVPDRHILKCLEKILGQSSIDDIAIIGNSAHKTAITQLKMNTYALMGRMRLEAGIYTSMHDSLGGYRLENAIKNAIKGDGPLRGVLCCPEYSPADADDGAIDSALLESAWQTSVGFLNVASQTCLSRMKLSVDGDAESGAAYESKVSKETPFFHVVDPSTTTYLSRVTQPACAALMDVIRESGQARGIDYGVADILSSPASRTDSARPGTASLPHLDTNMPHEDVALEELSPESPTNLWSMWAVANEIEI